MSGTVCMSSPYKRYFSINYLLVSIEVLLAPQIVKEELFCICIYFEEAQSILYEYKGDCNRVVSTSSSGTTGKR
jgi:hypothetical protein